MKTQLMTQKAGYKAPAITVYDMALEDVICAGSGGIRNDEIHVDESWFFDDEMGLGL